MAPSRLLLLAAGACSAAATAGDVESLLQRDVGVHTQDNSSIQLFRVEDLDYTSMEAPPKLMDRIRATVGDRLHGVMAPFAESAGKFLQAAETPFTSIVGEQLHEFSKWDVEHLTEVGAGYVLGFRDAKFSGVVNASTEKVSEVCRKLGAKMGSISAGLAQHMDAVGDDVKEVLYWTEHSAFQTSEAMAEAAGLYFDAMAAFLRTLPTKYLQEASRVLLEKMERHSSAEMKKLNVEELEPGTKKFFAAENVCEPLKTEVIVAFGKMVDAMKKDASLAAAEMKQSVSDLLPYIALVSSQGEEIVASLHSFLDSFGSAVYSMGVGFHMYHEVLTEVVKQKLNNCTKSA
uniref:Uncharacterized protein n=1 Tax=Alexandrium catenella TaxID=2925 RepID=A0A7S1R964_ALECA|mmetsp:Transcript_48675/g.130291  ORF Transcript_48675/g.130291 Transcript_48675/m.130291 type:complete len:346 (+) Transcript_48675:74-1111(+)